MLGLGWVGGGGQVEWEDLSMPEFFMREENFHEGVVGFSSIIYKKTMRKLFFFQLEVMINIKT